MDDRRIIDAPGVTIWQCAPVRTLILRIRNAPAARIRSLSFSLGVGEDMPGPNRAAGQNPRVAWLAPGEWMIRGTAGPTPDVASLAPDVTAHLADISDGRICFAFKGEAVGDILSKASPLDFHPRVFGIDDCAQTLFAQTRVLIERVEADRPFLLHADISFADHLKGWLAQASAEYLP
ncbi:sarcosine oxidase subunit gamma [Sphingopyxis terrae]|uniref:sarcosine oxidase subunit gamma n=1 Tax=Sphingopyxis terrae TaxID=33052 RepID=UPI002A135BF4|nr:sarcosine oxidase subunit gamma family protein [Sphingopyxis terrae]MDX8356507.1 sarcosine oxidase subunit gamma family protein [Sphingopyxis terrae]